MRDRGFPFHVRLFVSTFFTALLCGLFTSAFAAIQNSPQVFSVSSTSTRAVVLESVSMRTEPFSLNSAGNFSPSDPRTRLTLFCANLDLLSGETANALSADAEDAALFNPPTVFSYYPADYVLPGTNLLAPEFGILDSQIAYPRINFVDTLFLANNGNGLPALGAGRQSPTGTQINYANYQAQAGSPETLVDMLNTMMLHSSMSPAMRTSIIEAVNSIPSSDPSMRTRVAIYLVATSSQYQVQR